MSVDEPSSATLEGTEPDSCCRAYHHGDLKNSLVEAALEVIVEKGVSGASLREIARRAGVSPRAPYHHFEDKLCLLAAVARSGFEKLDALMVDTLKIVDPEERLLELGLRYLQFAKDHPAEFQTMHWDELCEEEAFPDREEVANRPFGYLLDTLAAVAGRELDEEELELHGILAWSVVHGLAQLRADGVLAASKPAFRSAGPNEENYLRGILRANVVMQVHQLRTGTSSV